MTINWSGYEGSLAGKWRLGSFLGARDDKAFFIVRSESHPGELLIHIVPGGTGRAASVLESWTRAAGLPGEGLLRPVETGQSDLDGVPINYAVTGMPVDDLSEILARRPLEHAEAVKLLRAVACGLECLHARGLSHGSVIPSNVFYLPDGIKLSVDTISPATRGGKQADLRQLGTMLEESLPRLDPPFDRIVSACLNGPAGEWTVTDIKKALIPAPRRWRGVPIRRFAVPAAALAGVLAVFLIWHKPTPPPAAPIVQKARTASPSPVSTTVPKPTPFAHRDPAQPSGTAERSNRRESRSHSWAVIAAAYNDFQGAQRLANGMQKKWPQWKMHVSPPDGQGHRYFVVIGSGLTREEADELLRSARAQGAPRDTYVTLLDESNKG